MTRISKSLATLSLLLGFLTSGLLAQSPCFLPDGLDTPAGACCIPAAPQLPVFPARVIQSNGACFFNCAVEATFGVNINLGAPIPALCDTYGVAMTITGAVNTSPQFMICKYQRTWEEIDPTGLGQRQVWRFLVNVDLVYIGTAGATPCPRPTCTLSGVPVHFVGSLDYAFDCTTSVWSAAINLTHHCGDLSHGPFSSRPVPAANAHPQRLYAFAGPAPFNFAAPVPPPTGGIIADSTRSTAANFTVFPALWQCFSELPVFMGSLSSLTQSCPCGPGTATAPPRWHEMDLNFGFGCFGIPPSFFQGLPGWVSAPTGLRAFELGTYAGPPAAYPGNESVSVFFGVASAPDVCANNFPFHLVHGVATRGGPPAILFGGATGVITTDRFVDLENMQVINTANPAIIQPGFGALFLSTVNWNLNL